MKTAIRSIVWAKALGFAVVLAVGLCMTRPASAVDLSGCWSGTWQSCVTPHKGPLNAHFTKCNDSQYYVTFTGRFFKIFPFKYSVTLDVIQDGDVVQLSGSSYLGKMFGMFYYNATADACNFNSTYTSCKDNGLFSLTRCCQTCCN